MQKSKKRFFFNNFIHVYKYYTFYLIKIRINKYQVILGLFQLLLYEKSVIKMLIINNSHN